MVLEVFPDVVVCLKLEFYVNCRRWDRHMGVSRQ